MTLGVYQRMTLAGAREAVAKARVALEKGKDPGTELVAAKRAVREGETFADLAKEWVERYAMQNRKNWEGDKWLLAVDAIPAWGKRKAKSITRKDIIRLTDKIMDRGAPVMANRTLSLLKQVFKFGVQREILDASPAVAIDKPAKEKRRDRVLSEDEIRAFWTGLDKGSMSEDSRIALKLCLVTAQRRGEVSGMCHSEIEGDWWALPKERSKNGKAHRVPLSPLAKQLIQQASGDDHLFPSPLGTGPIHARSLTNAVIANRDHFDTEPFCVHDLRRTATTYMAQIGVPRFDIAKVLNHTDREITAIYDWHSYDAEKREALLKWSRQLKNILDGEESDIR